VFNNNEADSSSTDQLRPIYLQAKSDAENSAQFSWLYSSPCFVGNLLLHHPLTSRIPSGDLSGSRRITGRRWSSGGGNMGPHWCHDSFSPGDLTHAPQIPVLSMRHVRRQVAPSGPSHRPHSLSGARCSANCRISRAEPSWLLSSISVVYLDRCP